MNKRVLAAGSALAMATAAPASAATLTMIAPLGGTDGWYPNGSPAVDVGGDLYGIAADVSTGTPSEDLRLADTGLVAAPAAAGDVPEPATWGTMLLGLGLMGGALRSRPRVRHVAA